MKSGVIENDFPYFLEDYGNLLDHLQNELPEKDRGDLFENFVQKLISQSEIGERFEWPQKTPYNDKGLDFICEGKDNTERLYAQAKFKIRDVKTIGGILSDFMSYEDRILEPATYQRPLDIEIPGEEDDTRQDNTIKLHFMIVTSGSIKKGIIPKYEKEKPSATYDFYTKLNSEGRLHIIDGPDILLLLRQAYRKDHFLPSNLELKLAKPLIRMEDVYIGIIEGNHLKRLYKEFGNSLFLENIREYLGPQSGRITSRKEKSVNEKIIDTLQNEPNKFLARNNGITFRASSIEVIDELTLKLDDASIVNGCQTTMSIVRHPSENSYVMVKVVQAENAWDIAEAANFQNEIKRIYLSMARYIGPAAVKSVASKAGIRYQSTSKEASANAILDTVYENEITQEEVSSLFIALFSRTPNNVVHTNYAELRTDIIDQIYENPSGLDDTLQTLFKVHQIIQKASEVSQEDLSEDLSELFQRFWNQKKTSYRAFLAVLATCGCIDANIYEKGNTYEDITKFLENLQDIIVNKPDLFIRCYQHAFTAVAFEVMKEGEARVETLKNMSTYIERAKFQQLYYKVSLLIKNDRSIK